MAKDRGVPYFSAAGNAGKQSWEGTFRGSGQFDANNCELHQFSVSGDTRQRIRISGDVRISFQWQDPFFSVSGVGASRDMDFRIYDRVGRLITQDLSIDTGDDPVAVLAVTGVVGSIELEFSLCTPNASPPLMKWIAFDAIVNNIEYDTQSSTLFGHPNAAFVAGVGAAFFRDTPAFGTDPPVLESFSSPGGTPILFDRFGAPVNETRQQPRFVATDGCINTFFGDNTAFAPNGQGFYFFGYVSSLFFFILL